MPPVHYTDDDYTQMKTDQRFKQLAEFRDDFGTFTSFVNDPANTNHKKFGPYAMAQVRAFSPEVEKEVGPAANPGLFSIFLEQGLSQNFVAASKSGGGLLVWSCWRSEEERRKNDVDGAGCLRTLGALAIGTRTGVGLSLPGQEDKAFMWKAPSVHPLQVLENAYQRIVQKAGRRGRQTRSRPKPTRSPATSSWTRDGPSLSNTSRSIGSTGITCRRSR